MTTDNLQGFRLSPQQRRAWRLWQTDGGFRTARLHLEVAPEVDLDHLRSAFATIARRHDVLRTSYARLSGMVQPIQRVAKPAQPAFHEIDLTSEEDPRERLAELWEEAGVRAEDDAEGALRLALVHLPEGERHLLVSLPSLSLDPRSARNLLAEVETLLAGDEPAAAPVSYPQFAEYQNALYEGPQGEELRAAWDRLEGDPEADPALRFRRAADAEAAGRERFRVEIDAADLAADLERLAGEAGVDSAPVLLAAWQALLWRLGGASGDVRVAHLAAGRPHEIFAGGLGLFARWVPVTAFPEAGMTFRRLVGQVAEAMATAEESAEGWLWPTEGPGRPAAGFRHAAEPTATEERRLRLRSRELWAEDAELVLACEVHGDSATDTLTLALEGDAALYDEADARRTLEQLRVLLTSALADGERALERLEVLSADEHRRLVEEFNTVEAAEPVETLVAAFAERAAARPEALALVTGDRRLTYGELDRESNRLAHALLASGVGPDVPVALVLDRGAEAVVALLATWKAGGAYCFLNPGQPRHRTARMLARLAPAAVLTRSSLADDVVRALGEAGEDGEGLAAAILSLDGDAEDIAARSDERPRVTVDPGSLAYVLFTSGSTGEPKGVAVEHRQAAAYTAGVSRRFGFAADERYAVISTLAADLGNTMLFPALTLGGTLYLVPEGAVTDARAVGALMEREGIDHLKIVPSHFAALFEGEDRSARARVLPRRSLVFGGEALRPELVAEVRATAPELSVFNHYGPTETTVGVLTAPAHGDEAGATVPLGHPLSGARVYLADRRGNPVPTAVVGELLAGGAQVTRGYLGDPRQTAHRFLPDAFSGRSGARLYRTGDLARHLARGGVEFAGRADHQVKIRGLRVELDEVRRALLAGDGVRDGVVAKKSDDGGHEHLVAYYVAPQPLDGASLRDAMGEILPEEILPSLFVHLNKLPLTGNGKVDLEALPSVEEARQREARPFRAARGPAEELMVSLWADVLGLERVSIDDDFFALGGHSLLATQLVSRVRVDFGVELPIGTLFEHTTPAALTAVVERRLAAADAGEAPGAALVATPITPVERSADGMPLSFAQERLWFMDQMDPGNAAYNMVGAVRLLGELDDSALVGSLEALVERHESLRTTFFSEQGEGRQRVAEDGELALTRDDLSHLDAGEREAALGLRLEEEAETPFDLEAGPLFRVRLVKLGGEEHALVLALHHVVADGWSIAVLVDEVARLYEARVTGRPAHLPALPVQYADYAAWQRETLDGEVLEGQLDFWRRELAGAPASLDLPTDRPRPDEPTFVGDHYRFDLPAELAGRVEALAREHRATPFMVLLAAFYVFLAKQTGREDLVVGTDIANRNREETEGLIGFFVNNLVLRADLSGDPAFGELLEQVRRRSLAAYAHQDLPFERLVKALSPKRALSRMPLFEVLFVVQNAPAGRRELTGLAVEPLDLVPRHAKFDLAVFVREAATPGGPLNVSFNYRTELFDEATVARFAEQYRRVLEQVCADADERLSNLEIRSESDKRKESMQKEQRQARKRQGIKGIRRRQKNTGPVEVVRFGFLGDEEALPRLIEPAVPGVVLADWAKQNRERVNRELDRFGGILFRGFDLRSTEDLEAVAKGVCDHVYGDYGDLPNEKGKIYRSTPYPADKRILYHNESSHLSSWPTRQMFLCQKAASEGGETPIVDCRQMYRHLDPALAAELEEKQVMYVRNFSGLDVSWQDFFKTDDRAEVERKCREQGMEFEWVGEDGLRTRQVCDAVVRHPRTGEKVLFNQVQLHHQACLDPEVRESMGSVFAADELPRDFRFGDGSPVPDEAVAEISRLYDELAAVFTWREGDLVLLDNMLVAHARNAFRGERKIIVAMGDMMTRDELQAAVVA